MKTPRAIRILLLANDGLSAGHVTRALAVARALGRRAPAAGVAVRLLLATTSEADRLLAAEGVPSVRLPPPALARRWGWSDVERRALHEQVLRGVVSGFRPDLLVVDTFPSGPHGEAGALVREIPRRALVRRTVRAERAAEPALSARLADYHLAIVPGDPAGDADEALPVPSVRVPPITLGEAAEGISRARAREKLGLPQEGRFVLVASGGGGDPEASAILARVAEAVARAPGGFTPVIAEGPLAREAAGGARVVREAPLQPLLSAFDGAVAAAGYNLAHELAKAGVPAALFARPRMYDDQAARAERFARAGIGRALGGLDDDEIAAALGWMERAPRPSLPAGGADAAADALLRLVTGGQPVKIAFHAINGVGLGHLVRVVTLAEEVRSLVPEAALLVLTSAGDTTLLARAGIDFVALPPRLGEPHADADRSRRALPDPLEQAALAAALTVFGPDLVVFDTHAPLPLARHAASIGARSVLVQRELRPEALRAFLASAAPSAFDRIVVPHPRGEVDLAPFAGTLPVVAPGPVVRPLSAKLSARLSRRLDLDPRAPLVVVMAGGGGQPVDARRFLRAAADAHLLARARIPGLRTILVAGPYGAVPEHLDGFEGLTALGRCDELPALLARATLVVSQAGYNAVAEIRALRKPAILVPGQRKAEDQAARAARLARIGAAVIARPSARSIADWIEALVAPVAQTSPPNPLSPVRDRELVALFTPGRGGAGDCLRLPPLPAPQVVQSAQVSRRERGAGGVRSARLEAMSDAHASDPLVPANRAVAEALLGPVWAPARPVRRAVLVAHDFAPKLGGMETVARSLAQGLAARGVEVFVYTTKRLGVPAAFAPGVTVRPLYVPGPGVRRIDLHADLLATLDALLADAPDVVHLCHAGLGPWVPALLASLPCAVTVSVHGNDLLSPWVHHGCDPEAYRAAQIAGLGAADAVLAVSSFSASLARDRGVRPAIVETIENGVDADRFSPGPADAALAARLGIDPSDEVVLTVSRLAPRKGHATVLRALREVLRSRPRARFVFTGQHPRIEAELLALAGALGVRERVLPLGFVDDGELPALYRLAHVFALLSEGDPAADVEGFGVALLEAAASGLPTVATTSGGVPEAVEDGVTGVLVAPGDAAGAARAIAALLADPAEARAMGRRGRERAASRFSCEATTARVLDRWTAVTSRGPRRTAPLSGLAELFGGAESGAGLVRLAQREAAARRAAREQRRETFARIAARGNTVRLRATGEGARLLFDALADCAALGHAPEVEVKLRRFAEADFSAHAMPLLSGVHLVHGAPAEGAASLLARLAALPRELFARVRRARIFLTLEAQQDGALAIASVPEVHALRRLLAERGVTVVPPPELMRYLSETPAGGPETGMIEPTNACNLACPTCPTGTGKIKPRPAMTLDRFDAAIAELSPRLRNLALWNYGEPLLNKDLPAMIARAKAAGVAVVKVSSNVHFLDGARGRALLGSGLDVLILSVDGASEASYQVFRKDGDFATVARQVAWLCAEKRRLELEKPRIELQFIVMRHNEHELPEIRRLAAEWGVDRLRIKTVGADDEATRDLVPATRLYSRYEDDRQTPNARHPFCTMAWDHTVVNVDGSVTPCCYLRPDMGERFVMGNVFETPFLTIWRGPAYRAFRAAMLDGREAMPVCDRCRGGTHDLVAAQEEVPAR